MACTFALRACICLCTGWDVAKEHTHSVRTTPSLSLLLAHNSSSFHRSTTTLRARAGPRANSHRHLALALAVAAVRLGITVTSLYLAARKEGRGTRRRLASAASALRLQARGRRLSHMHLWLPHAAAADGAESCLGRTAASCRRAARALIVVRAAGSWGPALAPRGALACAARPAPWPRGCGRLVGASPASRCA